MIQSQCSASDAGFNSTSADVTVLPCGSVIQPATYGNCDVDMLKLSGSGASRTGPLGNLGLEVTVSCTELAANDTSLTKKHRDLLRSDDLLVQVVADYHREGSYDPQKLEHAKINIEGFTSPACPATLHSLIIWTGGNGQDTANKSWLMCTPETQEVLSQSTRSGSGTGGFLKPFWCFGENRRATYRALIDSCGIRDGAVPVCSLIGRVEVFPNDRFDLTFKLPPMGKVSWQESQSRNLRTGDSTRTSSRTIASNFGREEKGTSSSNTTGIGTDIRTESRTKSDKGLVSTNSTSQGERKSEDYYSETTSLSERGAFSSYTIKNTDATDAAAPKFSDETAYNGISLKHNGVEVDITKTLNSVIKAATDLKSAFDNFKDAIPKVGWQADLDIGVLEGSITGSWGVHERTQATHARIWEVEEFYEITLDVKLIFLKFEVGFGLEFVIENWFSSNPLLEVILKIAFSFELTLPLKGTFSSNSRGNVSVSAAAEAQPKLEAIARASAAGYTCEISASLSGSIKAIGAFVCGFDQAPIAQGKLEWSPLALVVVVARPGARPWREELWRYPKGRNPEPLWEGTLPST